MINSLPYKLRPSRLPELLLLLLPSLLLTACAQPVESLPPVAKVSSGTTSSAITGEAPESTSSTVSDEASTADQDKDAESDASVAKVVVTLANYDEQQDAVKKLAGKVVVMDIWSTSCIPCMKEFPNLVALSKKYPDKVACISLNIDYIGLKKKLPETYLPQIRAFLEKQQATIINLASSDRDEEILNKYEVSSMPAIIVYDVTGKLHKKLTDSNTGEDGLTYEGDVIPLVEELLSASL